MIEADPILVDARGHRCPVPSLRLRRALEAATPGDLVRLLTDDPLARIDVPHLLGQLGDELVSVEAVGSGWTFLARKGTAPAIHPLEQRP